NGISQGTSTPFDDYDEHIFEVNDINIGGGFTIQITNITAKQVIIDDITWTSFDGPANIPPVIANITQTPATDIMDDQTVSVSADVTDSDGTIASVILNWGTTSGNLSNSISMSVSSGDTYTTDTDIPAQAGGTSVYYAITAADDLAAETTSAEQSYTVVILDPALVLTPDALSGFEYELGEGPSTSQSYTVSGFNFVGSGLVDVTAPASFEISIDNSDWFNSLVLQYADGELIAQPRTIYVRMKAGLTAGEKDEAISHQDVNIGLVELPVSGEVTSVTQVADIAALRQGATDGTVYQLTGEAILTFAGSSRNQKFIQDATAGILIDDAAGNITTAYEIGDGITGLTGTLSVYQNMVQFVPQTDAGAPTSTGNTITPVEVTLDALDATYQAQLVKVNFVDFNTTGNFSQGSNYTITDPTGNGVMRTQYSNLDYIGTPIPETTQNLTAVIMQFSSTMQLIPRSLEDFEDAPITDPTIFADPMVINGLSYPVGGGPSNPQSFMISGVNLTSGISVTTSSPYFDISPTGGSNFVPTSPIILNHTNGVVEETPVYVRLKAGLDLGNYNGEEIVANSSGAENAVITLNGTVYDGSAGGGGLETFANLDLEGSSYADGSFLGQDGSTWTYFQSRGDVEITGKALMLGRNRTPQANVYSGTIFGGIGTINFDYMQAFSTGVNLNVLVNDVVVGNVTSDGEQNVIKNSGTITVNVDGPVTIKFISANNSDGQVVIDNVAWTAYEGGLPVAAAPSFDPPAGSYADPVNVTLSSATANADIFFSQSSENGPWTAYSTPIAVDDATTIWAYATADDHEDSPVVSAAYTFTDVVSVATIAELRAGATDGTVYQLTGEAVLTFQTSTRNQKFIQDATGAILIDDNGGAITTSYNLYDGITGISGTLSTYSNMLQFVPETDPGAASSTGNTVTPVEVSLDELDNTYQAQLVTVNFADFEATGNFASGQNYTITDPSGSGVMRTQYSDLDYIGEPIPTTTQNITGVILQFSSTMQLVPRSLADFEEANITDPFIAVSPTTLNGFNYEIGNGPSAEQSFVVSALNLTADLSLDAPANYEISLGTGGSFVATDPVLLTPTDGTVDETTVYVRLKAGLDVGTYNGEQVLATSTGATNKTVTLNGNVSDPSAGGGFETFANLDYDGNSYVDGTFLGQDGSTWTYVQARGDLQITDESITLGRNRDPQSNVYSGLLDGGIGVINFDYMQAFSTDVNLNIMVNDVVVGTVTSAGEQDIVKNSGDIVVNVPGQVVIKFMNVNNSDGQVVIDNISWTAYDGGTPVVLAPTFNPPAGNYFDPIDVTISSATSGATVFYSTESATGPWTEFTAPVNVSEETTIWAYGELDGYTNSAVSSANYTFGDVVQVATIAELRLGSTDGTVYQLTGEAILTFQSSERNQKFIQDATAAILIDDNSGNITTTYDLYDGITGITGTLSTYAEMLQFVPQSDPGAATSTGNTVDPLLVSLSDLDNTYQAQLVTVNMVDFLTDGLFEDGVNYDITDPSGDGIFRTHYSDVDYIGTDIPVELQNITGVILQFNDDMQLVARNLNDFEDANITDPYLTVNPATLNGFSYFVGEGPSASQSYQLSGQNLEGSGNITVAAPENYEISIDDNSFVTSLDFPFADGVITGQPITVYVRMKADLEVGLYEGETIAHTGGNAPEVLVTLNGEVTGEVVPAISFEIVPQYIQGINGTNNNRLPYAYWLTLSNLTADATYRYINQAVVAGDDATTNGAGNVIFTNLSGNFYRSTSPSFSTDGSYGLFTTDSDGSYSGWFITEATANSRFTPGNEVFMRVRLNDGNDGTATETYLTTTNGATVINFGTENDPTQGTAIRAISGDLPKSFALLYDNNREGQPIAATSIETTGIDFAGISQYATFYKDEVAGNDGHWGTIIPNSNENGIQLIEIRDLVDGAVLKTYQAADGVWGTTNTVNPVGGLDEILVIDLIEIGLADNLAAILKVYATQQQFVIEKASTEKLRLDVYNLMGQPMMQTELNGIGTQKLSHHLSSGVYILHLTTESGLKQAVKVIIR
ncbi:MAG: T9SS type A sorting domain-containing protein, partial [Bacteroidetes bacterium]|nr:T9SS type A sorting domain-containing protein [Bacteroidota bacterium]